MYVTEGPGSARSPASPGDIGAPITEREQRLFGIAVGTIAVVVGLLLLYQGRVWWVACAGLGGVLLTAGMLRPRALRWPAAAWIGLGRILHLLFFYLLFGAAYYLVFTPTGLLLRLLGRDPLRLRAGVHRTLWIRTADKPFSPEDMEKPF